MCAGRAGACSIAFALTCCRRCGSLPPPCSRTASLENLTPPPDCRPIPERTNPPPQSSDSGAEGQCTGYGSFVCMPLCLCVCVAGGDVCVSLSNSLSVRLALTVGWLAEGSAAEEDRVAPVPPPPTTFGVVPASPLGGGGGQSAKGNASRLSAAGTHPIVIRTSTVQSEDLVFPAAVPVRQHVKEVQTEDEDEGEELDDADERLETLPPSLNSSPAVHHPSIALQKRAVRLAGREELGGFLAITSPARPLRRLFGTCGNRWPPHTPRASRRGQKWHRRCSNGKAERSQKRAGPHGGEAAVARAPPTKPGYALDVADENYAASSRHARGQVARRAVLSDRDDPQAPALAHLTSNGVRGGAFPCQRTGRSPQCPTFLCFLVQNSLGTLLKKSRERLHHVDSVTSDEE
jgi:hypothetical protein